MSEKKYSRIQMIGMAISTTPGDLRSIEDTSDDGRYLGLNDSHQDILARLKLLKQAIVHAYEMHDKSRDVLKVFTVPEFFFRGNKGAYYGNNREIFENHIKIFVKEFLCHDDFADWLFVLGTFLTSDKVADCTIEPAKGLAEVGASLVSVYNRLHPKNDEIAGSDTASEVSSLSDLLRCLDEKGNVASDEPSVSELLNSDVQPNDSDFLNILSASLKHCDSIADIDVYNCCYIVVGGSPELKAFSVQKKYKSKEDFILKGPNDNYLQTTTRYPHINNGSEIKKHHYDQYSVFTYHGIKFGIEICLDHRCGRLINAYREHNGQLVDVQIIVSCGMDIRSAYVAAVKDGIVFNCDGETENKQAENGDHCHTMLQIVSTPPSQNNSASLSNCIPLDSKSKIEFPYTVGFYPCKSYQIHVYKPIDLPKNR